MESSSPGKATWLDAIGLAEGGLLADVAVVLDLASIYLPVIGIAIGVATPTPFAALFWRRGPRVTLLAIAVATFLVTVLAGPHFGWRMGLQGLVGLLLGWAMKRRVPRLAILASGILLVAFVAFLATLAVIYFTGLPVADIVAEIHNGFHILGAWIGASAALLGLGGWWRAAQPAYTLLEQGAARYWPLGSFLGAAFIATPTVALYYTVANSALTILGHDPAPFPPEWLLEWIRRAMSRAGAPLARLRRSRRAPLTPRRRGTGVRAEPMRVEPMRVASGALPRLSGSAEGGAPSVPSGRERTV